MERGRLPWQAGVKWKVIPRKEGWTEAIYNNNNNNNNNTLERSHEGKVTILWNQQVQTGKTSHYNKSEVIISNYEKGTWMLIDVTVSGDKNVIKTEVKKILKYRNLTI